MAIQALGGMRPDDIRAAAPSRPMPSSGPIKNEAQARKLAKDYEAVFISQVMQNVFKGVDVDPLFGGGQSEDLYKSMLNDEYARGIASAGGFGLAEPITRQLLQIQEGSR